MKRRQFIRESGALAFGIGTFGNISWAERAFVGDTATTTDVLGPFYRPGAPIRQNLNPLGFRGEVLQLFGTIYKEDGKTPMPNCFVEVWQCRADGLYDTVSNDFAYRGSQRVGGDGCYRFITTQPVPEPVDANSSVFRPAHIHLRISAIGEQDLITQIYFAGDPYLAGDPSTRSALAVNRILALKKRKNDESEIRFDVVLKKQQLADDRLLHDVSGVYKMSNGTAMEFYRNGDLLFYKTDHQIWGALSYAGNHTFVGGVDDTEARFELLPQGKATVRFRFIRRKKLELEGTKFLRYENQG